MVYSPKITKDELIKIIIVFLVFFLFLSAAIGLVEISINQHSFFKIHSRFFNDAENYNRFLNNILFSKEFMFLLCSGFIFTFIVPLISPIKASLITFTTIPIALFLGYSGSDNPVIPVEYLLLTILVLYISNILISYFIEVHSKQRLIDTFSQYIPPHLVNELSKRPKELSLEGEAKTLTVFFCDLHNFTSISEQLNPKQLNKLLNEYFNVMTEILFKYDGTIDKYIGDAIMAFWNAPLSQSKHAQLAVEAGLEMDQAINKLANEFIAKGWPGPTMGVGINTGRANVGNMGSRYRMMYTAIGDAVNLASRIESLTRLYRVPIIISEDTLKCINGITCRELDLVRVRGKKHLTRIFQPVCKDTDMDAQLKEKLTLHDEALDLYHNEKYKNALSLFKDLYEMDKNDKYYKAMIKIIVESKIN